MSEYALSNRPVCFAVTVDQSLSQKAECVIRSECGARVRSISLEPLPDRHEVRLWVTLAALAYGLAVHAIVSGLPAAEFGKVEMAQTEFRPMSEPIAA